jgi:hypothetical protein
VEGPLDSMFLENAIAAGGSDLRTHVSRITNDKERPVLVFDNQPRNKAIVSAVEGAIDKGYKVCIWPSEFEADKDINNMVLSGMNPSLIQYIIDQNTYEGLTARLKFKEWKKT